MDGSSVPPPPPTIIARKHDFVAAQTRILTQQQPLRPSRAWRAANDAADHGLPTHAVEDVLFQANHALQQHCRRVYSPLATRLVAEQIDKIFTKAAEHGIEDGGEGGGDRIPGVEIDLTSNAVIPFLPHAWPPDRRARAFPHEASRYTELVDRLGSLNERRNEVLARVRRLRRMKAMLEPFQVEARAPTTEGDGVVAGDSRRENPSTPETAAAPPGGVQENIITRGCELETELERTKLLLARVGARVALLSEPDRQGAEATVDWAALENDKVGKILDSF